MLSSKYGTSYFIYLKAEEKLHIIHAKKCRQMKSLTQKGGDARRVDSMRTLIVALSTKMIVAVQVIDNIAITINKLMDEELWPLINELIHRYIANLVQITLSQEHKEKTYST